MPAPLKHNVDMDLPWSKYLPFATLMTPTFDLISKPLSIPILWGPNQLTLNFPAYDPPDNTKWHKFETVQIPQVIRFIHSENKNQKYDDQAYKKTSSGPQTKLWQLFSYTIITTSYTDPRIGLVVTTTYMLNYKVTINGVLVPGAGALSYGLALTNGLTLAEGLAAFPIGIKFSYLIPGPPTSLGVWDFNPDHPSGADAHYFIRGNGARVVPQ